MTQSQSHEVNDRRPAVLEQFLGQRGVIDRVRIALEASWQDGARLPHMLFCGGGGLGKTQLAEVIAKERACGLRQQLGQNICCVEALHGFLVEASDQEILFIDEIHLMYPIAQTALFRALEERRLFIEPTPFSNRRQEIRLADFTLLAATTDQYALLDPLLQRFKIVAHFSKYAPAELEQLLTQRCRMLGWSVRPEVLNMLSHRGRGVPRLALRLLEATHRTARAEGAAAITLRHFEKTCLLERVDDAGLDELEMRYLTLLHEAKAPVRLNVIAAKLGLPTKTIQRIVETALVEEGYIDKSESGQRALTEKGLRHLSSKTE